MRSGNTIPSYFISHGGGPWPYMKQEQGTLYGKMEASFKQIPRELGANVRAVLMISAHWEEKDFTVMAQIDPPMLYDYGGFPEHTYKIKYPAEGNPKLANDVRKLLMDAGFACKLELERGFDHGAFVPLSVMYPNADVPVVQLSLKKGLDPAEHIACGEALASLRAQGVLVLGSGYSYHNLRHFGASGKVYSEAFDAWLQEVLTKGTPDKRMQHLLAWESAPQARGAHPREEHLLPLMVAVGAAKNEKATCIYHEENFMGGITQSAFRFGKPIVVDHSHT